MTEVRPIFPKGGRVHGLWDQAGTDPALKPMVASIFAKYPTLAKHASDYAVTQGRPMVPGDDRQLETYLPSESWSPMPGKAVTELYNQDPAQAPNLVAGDMLHHLADVDPQWAKMKADVVPQAMQPDHLLSPGHRVDPQVYRSRGDEFLMGFLTPDKADEWAKAYTPEQRQKLEFMRQYLMGQQ